MSSAPSVAPPPSVAHPGVFTKRESIEDAVLLERQAVDLENQGQDLASVRNMERALLLRCRDGVIDDACLSAAERLIIKCNTVAVRAFKTDDYSTACTLLDNALRLTDGDTEPLRGFETKRQRLRGTTLNNYGCLERRRGHLQESLRLLTMSLDYAGQQSPATYLNISAICSQIGRQDEAVGHARRAVGLLVRLGDTSGMLAIAHHNLATALEGIDSAASDAAYTTALRLAVESFGQNSPTTQSIQRNMQRFHQRAKTVKPVTLPPIAPSASPTVPNNNSNRARSPPAGVNPRGPSKQALASSGKSAAGRSGRLPAMTSSSPAPPSVPRQRPQTEPGGRKPPTSGRPTTSGSDGVRNDDLEGRGTSGVTKSATALHPRPPPPGEKRREAFGASSTTAAAARSGQDPADKAAAAASKRNPSTSGDGESPPARRSSVSTPPMTTAGSQGVSPVSKELKVLTNATPRDRELSTPLSATGGGGRGGSTPRGRGATPREANNALAGSGKAATTSPSSLPIGVGDAAAAGSDVLPTLPQKPDDLATFMLTRLGTLLTAEDKFEHIYRQVVRIQCMYRCFRGRKELQRRRDGRKRQARLHEITIHSAAKRIQRFLKASVRRRALHQTVAIARQLDTERKSRSAIVIQKAARRWLARRLVKAKRKLKYASLNAALTLQRWFRKEISIRRATSLVTAMTTARKTVLVTQRRWAAALRLQAAWRAAMARDATRDLRGSAMAARELVRRNRCTTAATKVEAWWRGLVARRGYATKHAARLLKREQLRAVERRRVAATILQGFARGIKCRNRTRPMREAQARARMERVQVERHQAALRIQSWLRMFLARAHFRVAVAQRTMRLEERARDAVVRRLQRHARAYVTRKALGSHVLSVSRKCSNDVTQPTTNTEVVVQHEEVQDTTEARAPTPSASSQDIMNNDEVLVVVVPPQPPQSAPTDSGEVADADEQQIQQRAESSPDQQSSAPCAAAGGLRPDPEEDGGATPLSPFSGGPLPEILGDSDLPSGRSPLRDGNDAFSGPRAGSDMTLARPPTPVNITCDDEDNDTPPMRAPSEVQPKKDCGSSEAQNDDAAADVVSPPQEEGGERPSVIDGPPAPSGPTEPNQHPSVASHQSSPVREEVVFQPRPPPARRYNDKHKAAGATLVRVARGFLGRMYAHNVSAIVSEYIDRLVDRHADSPSKANERPLVCTLLHQFEKDENVGRAQQKLIASDLAEMVVDLALFTESATATSAPQETSATNGEEDVVVVTVHSQSLCNETAVETDHQEQRRRNAVLAIQRNVRILLAKCKLAALREARRQRWEERRDNSSAGADWDEV